MKGNLLLIVAGLLHKKKIMMDKRRGLRLEL